MALPQNIKKWLNNRGITDELIASHRLDWNGYQIVIPILDSQGKFLFNKYRRDPFTNNHSLPKYRYDTGATAQLFNAHLISNFHQIIVTEGELDAIILEAHGFLGVSSTGGAGTFRDEWLPLLEGKEIFICFDNDEAGRKGAEKLLTKLPAKLIIFPRFKTDIRPPQPMEKDITDYFIKYKQTKEDFQKLLSEAKSHQLPLSPQPLPKIKQRHFLKTHYLNNRITKEDIFAAKEIPIAALYGKFLKLSNGRAIGRCPFHNETEGSFVIYMQQNKWHCFGACGKGGDAIDYIMQRDGCNFITAVKRLVNK